MVNKIEINNSIYYPQLDLKKDELSKAYRKLMSYNSAHNDYY